MRSRDLVAPTEDSNKSLGGPALALKGTDIHVDNDLPCGATLASTLNDNSDVERLAA